MKKISDIEPGDRLIIHAPYLAIALGAVEKGTSDNVNATVVHVTLLGVVVMVDGHDEECFCSFGDIVAILE